MTKAHHVVVTGIIMKDGKYLIAKRSPHEKAMPDQWTVPGGKLEMSDYIDRPKDTIHHWYNLFEHLLKREVKEETALDIKNISYLTDMVFVRPDGIPTVVVSMVADYAGGSVKLSPELTEHAWVTLEQAREYDLIEGIYEELEMLDRKLKGEKVERWERD